MSWQKKVVMAKKFLRLKLALLAETLVFSKDQKLFQLITIQEIPSMDADVDVNAIAANFGTTRSV